MDVVTEAGIRKLKTIITVIEYHNYLHFQRYKTGPSEKTFHVVMNCKMPSSPPSVFYFLRK